MGAGRSEGEAAPNRAVHRRGLLAICATCHHARPAKTGCNETRVLSLMSALPVNSGTLAGPCRTSYSNATPSRSFSSNHFSLRPRSGPCRHRRSAPNGGFSCLSHRVGSARYAHHGLPTPSVIWAARGRWLGCGRAYVPNWQTLLPSIADTSPFRRAAAPDSTSPRSRGWPSKSESYKEGPKASKADHHGVSSLS